MDYRPFTTGWEFILGTSRAYGATIGPVVLLTIGAAGGGQLPAPFLPSWLAPGAYVLPGGGSTA